MFTFGTIPLLLGRLVHFRCALFYSVIPLSSIIPNGVSDGNGGGNLSFFILKGKEIRAVAKDLYHFSRESYVTVDQKTGIVA